jgi:mono/diheme cytochrome c family protein
MSLRNRAETKMNKFYSHTLRLTAAAILCVAGANAQSPAGDAARGKQVFIDYTCYACHGFSGQNGTGMRLVPMKMSQTAFTAYVRSPRQMPSFSAKVLPDAKLADVYAYLKTLPDSAPPARSVPVLNSILNEK